MPSGDNLLATLALFDPAAASAEEWQTYHRFRQLRHEEESPDEPHTPDDVVERRLKLGDPYSKEQRWLWQRGDEVVAEVWASTLTPASPEYESSRHLLFADAWVLGPARRQGVGRGSLPALLSVMEETGARLLTADTCDESGKAFLQWLGTAPRYSEARSRLDLRLVDWEMVGRWVREGQARSPDSRLELYGDRLPPERREEFARVSTELLNTMPWEGLDHGEIVQTVETLDEWYRRLDLQGSLHDVYLCRDGDGAIAGMTDVIKHPYQPGFVRQLFTGVHPRARGRGVGKWLKAAMLEHVRGAHPDTLFVTTENARSNDAMLAINRTLGFRLYRTATTYQVSRDELVRRCGPAGPVSGQRE